MDAFACVCIYACRCLLIWQAAMALVGTSATNPVHSWCVSKHTCTSTLTHAYTGDALQQGGRDIEGMPLEELATEPRGRKLLAGQRDAIHRASVFSAKVRRCSEVVYKKRGFQ